MEKSFRIFSSFEAAREAEQLCDDRLSVAERFEDFMRLMEPYYTAAGRLQRVYRIDEYGRREVCDDWGVRVQPVSKP